MKLKTMFMTLGLAAAVGVGVFAGVSIKSEVKEAAAATTTSRLVAKLGNIGKWSQGSAKLCACLTDDTTTYWTTLQTMSSSQNLYVFDYSISFTPTKLIWVRMNPAATTGNWDQKYNQTGDLAMADATYLEDQWDPTASQCSQWTITGNVYTSKDHFVNPKVSMHVNTVEIVDGAPQVSGVVSLEEDEEFKVVNVADNTWSGFYNCPTALNSKFEGGSKEQLPGSGNIICKEAGTYDFFFNTETKKIWITRQDIVDADGWATYFKANVGCDPQGIAAPTGWSTVASNYASLSDDAKDYVYSYSSAATDNLGTALATYEWAVKHNPNNLERFVKNSGGSERPVARVTTPSIFTAESNNTMILLVVVISAAALTAIGGYLLIKRRKQDR